MAGGLLFVTQVAPYRDGPAGVHGVLDQAAVGVAQIAEMHGLRAQRIEDVRDLPAEMIRDARALALFTIGETPWNTPQRDAIIEQTRAGLLAICSIHSNRPSGCRKPNPWPTASTSPPVCLGIATPGVCSTATDTSSPECGL